MSIGAGFLPSTVLPNQRTWMVHLEKGLGNTNTTPKGRVSLHPEGVGLWQFFVALLFVESNPQSSTIEWYSWWKKSCSPVEVGSLSHYLQGFMTIPVAGLSFHQQYQIHDVLNKLFSFSWQSWESLSTPHICENHLAAHTGSLNLKKTRPFTETPQINHSFNKHRSRVWQVLLFTITASWSKMEFLRYPLLKSLPNQVYPVPWKSKSTILNGFWNRKDFILLV